MRKDLHFEIDLTLEPRYTKEFVVKKQDSINLFISLKNGGQYISVSEQIPRLYIRKPDSSIVVQGGTEELGDGSIILDGYRVIVELKNSALNTTGLCYAELELEDERGTLITQTFIFEVVDRITDTDEVIKAVDDIYILGELEQFIIQAKKDIEEVRTAINELQNNMEQAVEDFNLSIEELNQSIEDALNGFNEKVEGVTSEIDLKKEEAIKELKLKYLEHDNALGVRRQIILNEINNLANNRISDINIKGEEVINLIEDAKALVEEKIEEAYINASNQIETKLEDALNEISDSVTQERNGIIQLSLREQDKILAKTENGVAEIEETTNLCKEELNTIITNADELKTSLLSSIANAETQKQGLDTSIEGAGEKIEEIQRAITAIDELKALCEKLKADLEAENTEANENINELKTLNPEADIRIEELRRLIEEAKKYEVVVANWIANREPAQDLTEVNQQLEELYQAVEMLDAKFSDYYTKEEVDEIVEELKANSGNDTGFKGSIGLATKFASLATIRHYDNAPEPPIIEGSEYIGKVMYSYLSSNNYVMYRLIYLYNNPTKGYYPYLYVDTNETSEVYIKDKNIGKAFGTCKMYEKRADAAADASFSEVSSMGIIYDERAKTVFYHSDVPVYSDVNKSGIYREASGGEFISNFDLANTEGKYYVNVKKEDYKALQNMPDVKLTKDLEGVLYCSVKDNKIIQEITIEGITYTRTIGEQWTGLNTSNLVKKDVIANIEGLNADTYSDVESIFASCPKPNIHQDVIGEIDFRADVNKYYRVYTTKKTGNEMFYQTISSNGNSDIGYTKNRYYYIRYVYQNGVWSEDTSTYQYASCKAGYTEIYRNTLPVCKGTGTTTFDKNTIIKEATTGAEKKVINDFNLATTYGVYNIDVKERETVLNAPTELLTGILECVVAEGNITQKVSADNGDIYTRYFNGSEWTEWKKEAELPEGLDDFMIPFEGKINTHTYTNGDGMPEVYNWVNLNGLKVMWINVKHSEEEYNSGVNGLMMKTLNFPPETQIFNNIIMANIASYCRPGNITLSRIVQNAEIISNVSVRGRWRHTDNVPPNIDNFTIMCIGF